MVIREIYNIQVARISHKIHLN